MQAVAAEFSSHVSESSSFCPLIKTDGKSWSFRLRGWKILLLFGEKSLKQFISIHPVLLGGRAAAV